MRSNMGHSPNRRTKGWPRPLPPCWLLLAAAVGLTSPAAADLWYEHYDRAEKALESRDWSEAIAEINQALERKGDSGARVRTYGMNATAYFPYLKLGIAYYRLGQWDAALQAFETEQRLGAIAKSQTALDELERFRSRVEEAREDAAAEEAERIRQIVRTSLDDAKALEDRGQVDEAMQVVGRALAVAPDSPEARTALDRLQAEVARQQQEHDLAQRVAELRDRGETLLGQDQYGEAARVFRQALSLKPDAAVEALLDQAQAGLRAELRREQDATRRELLISQGLNEARDLEAAGQLAPALSRLESVIALDPANREARELQERLLELQADAEQESARLETIAELLAEADADFGGERFEESLAAANRILALEPGNATALEHVTRAYREISRRLLGSGVRENIRPAIRFADFRDELDDGSRVERVRRPEFRLSGVAIDDSRVEIVFYDEQGSPIPGTGSTQPVGEYYLTEFSLRYRLSPGPAVFRLVATDAQGLSSSSVYAVDYVPPIYRSAWFYSTPAAVLGAVFAALAWRLTARRNRLRKRRFNPYVAGAPVLDQKLFFGRERLVERILQTIHNNSLLLYGERRIGKTSIQHHLKRRLQALEDPHYDFYPVYVDLQGTPEERFFATLAEDVFQELAPVLDGLTPSAALDAPTPSYGYRDFVHDLRRVIRTLREKSSRQVRLVLLIDEVDELNDYDPRINQKLRSLFMKSFAEHLVAVVSGVEIKKQWERVASPWYNFFEEIEVRPIRREDARELITRPIRGIFKIEERLVDRIIALTDCRPYLIQKHCIALVNRLHEHNRRTATLADVEAVGRPEDV
ncbi:MAG: AAA family ATPase [bacterium]|nr:AAA family ATPase [bacterium]